jgi:hypothetical protein
VNSHRLVKFLASASIGALVLSGCFTGERPTLMPEKTVPAVSDTAIQEVIAILNSTPASNFTIAYEVVTKFGDLHTAATLAFDPSLGTSITIAEVRYIYLANGTTLTCSTITSDCAPGIDESRVSDRQLVSTIFKKATTERMQQDARVAVGSAVASDEVIVDNNASCSAIPVVDGNGATQSKTYCAFTDLGVVASMDTADLTITALSFTATATADQFSA